MKHLDDSHNWWTSPYDGDDAWEDGSVDKEEFYNSLSGWKREAVDELETDEEKDALMHKFWLKRKQNEWEDANC